MWNTFKVKHLLYGIFSISLLYFGLLNPVLLNTQIIKSYTEIRNCTLMWNILADFRYALFMYTYRVAKSNLDQLIKYISHYKDLT